MVANGFISESIAAEAAMRPLQVVPRKDRPPASAALVKNVLAELKGGQFNLEDLLQGRIQVYSTADARVQRIVADQLERGLELYEKRHPSAIGLIQGFVAVLRNSDASILAEAGGRRFYNGRAASYSDFNRAIESQRQPGSVMKPIVYLAAFREGIFDLAFDRSGRANRRAGWGRDKVDLQLRWSIQGDDSYAAGAGGVQERRRYLDHISGWDQ